MGKITDALKKVADERVARIQKKPEFQYIVKRVENSKIDAHVVSFHDSASPVAEQYKILRTNIQSLKFTKNCKSFAITSSIDSEGKTLTSVNLAISLAQEFNNKSVLLIDADMRKGKVAKYLGIKSYPGLAELLQGNTEAETVFVNPGIDNLTVIVSGKSPKHHSELLNTKKMEQLLAIFKTKFDYILIDTPPVMPLTDACILGPMVDGVIVVVQAGRTQRDMLKHVESRLTQARSKIVGYILSQVEEHLPRYLYKYANKYDNHYYYKYQQQAQTEAVEK